MFIKVNNFYLRNEKGYTITKAGNYEKVIYPYALWPNETASEAIGYFKTSQEAINRYEEMMK